MKNYTVVYEPIETDDEKIPAELQSQMDDLYYKVKKGKPSIKKKLDKLLRRYPKIPSLWNYLSTWYAVSGDVKNAERVNDELFERFPHYLFAIINKAVFEIRSGNFEEGYKMLGNGELDISTIFPERKTFHITEFSAYTRAAIHYLAATGRFDEVKAYIEKLKQEKFGGNFISELKDLAYHYRLERIKQNWEHFRQNDVRAIERTEPTVPQADALLTPRNAKYGYLYDSELWELDTQLLEKDMQEDLQSFVAELHYILQRATEVMECTFQEDEWTPAVLHASLLLAYTDSQNGFERLLDLFRQPAELVEIYTGDWEPDVLSAYFSHPFEGLLDTVKKFVLEPLVPVMYKNAILEALHLMTVADTRYLPEVTELLEELMITLREQKDNPELMDAELVGFVVGAAVDIKAAQLLPLIEELYAEGLVAEIIEGDFKEVKSRIMEEHFFASYKKYDNPIEHLIALNETAKDNDSSDWGANITGEGFDDGEDFDDDWDEYLNDDWDEDFDDDWDEDKPNIQTASNNYKGTSLNAPCPCGSGKKYKRCHGKK